MDNEGYLEPEIEVKDIKSDMIDNVTQLGDNQISDLHKIYLIKGIRKENFLIEIRKEKYKNIWC